MANELLKEEVDALKVLLDHEGYDYQDGAEADVLDSISTQLRLPSFYRAFLEELDPGDAIWRIGGQIAVQLHSADELPDFQADANHDNQFVIGTLNDHPLVLQKSSQDGDTAVFRLDEDGEEICVASSFTQFLKILHTGLEMLKSLDEFDSDEEVKADESYDDINDFEESAFEEGRDDLLNGYMEELEDIDDPECIKAWMPV